MIQNIQHPRKECVPLTVGLAWGNEENCIFAEKLDGKFAVRAVAGGILAGEDVRGIFTAFDCLEYGGEDVRGETFWNRAAMRNDLCLSAKIPWVRETHQRGGEFLEMILREGGEGVVMKRLAATYYDTMTACKRLQMWRCVVTALNHGTGGASIAEQLADGSLQDRGTVPLRNRAAHCRVGSLVKVEGECLSARGIILKPRPCKDTETSWLVQF